MYERTTLTLHFRRVLPLIHQTESAECGLACLAMVADWHGYRIDLASLRLHFPATQHGMTLAQLVQRANELKLNARAVRLEIEQLKQLARPCILHWDINHFVVLKHVNRKSIVIHDPATGIRHLDFATVNQHFTGVALELFPAPGFAVSDQRRKVKLSTLLGQTQGISAALCRIFCFAMVLEILALGGPLLNQLVIDDVLVARDESLLAIIVIALLLMAGAQTLISLARQWAVISLSLNFSLQWTANVFHHLIHLPIDWFEKRETGSISARFDAVDTLQSTLTDNLLSALLDSVLVLGMLVMMLIYSLPLTLIALLAAGLYGVLRALWYRRLRLAAEESWHASTRETSHFLETLHGILSLRVNGSLQSRENTWRNLNVRRRNTQLREQKLAMFYRVMESTLFSLVSAAVLWFGAMQVLNNQFSVGMLVACLSFQSRFSTSIGSLIDNLFAWKMLSIYSERLADIVLTPTDDAGAAFSAEPDIASDGLTPVIDVSALSFRYSEHEALLFRDITFSLLPGEIVALVGASGGGKTTLAKLLLGLYRPTSGSIRLFGMPLHTFNLADLRQHIGTVLQEDKLFSGSILENITLFASTRDEEKARQCAVLACIHEDISMLPMGYQTLIGELGGTLSGGQKQRLLLARALYKSPRLLILDEATSHLDTHSETRVNQTLRQLKLPVLMIAHRPETIAAADRALQIADGTLTALSR